jgi:hypothetical protein
MRYSFILVCFTLSNLFFDIKSNVIPVNCELDNNNQNGYCKTKEENKKSFNDLRSMLSFKPSHNQLCTFCHITLPIIRALIDSNKTEYFQAIATLVCLELKISDEYVCSKGVSSYKVPVFFVDLHFLVLMSIILNHCYNF